MVSQFGPVVRPAIANIYSNIHLQIYERRALLYECFFQTLQTLQIFFIIQVLFLRLFQFNTKHSFNNLYKDIS